MSTQHTSSPSPPAAEQSAWAGRTRPAARPSVWLTIGAALVLSCVVAAVTLLSIDRNESNMARLLGEKGSALIRAVESALRTGVRTQVAVQLQAMLQEMVSSDVLFIAVAMPDGTILAHSAPERLGEVLDINGREVDESLLQGLSSDNNGSQVRWFIAPMEGRRAFVVYREFMPEFSQRGPPGPQPLIFLGLDLSPFEMTRSQDRNHIAALASGVLLAGVASLLALYYAQRARESRRRQRLAEGQVRALEEEVRRKEKMAAIGNLAAGVAHEIRNPLSSIKGYATYFGQRFAAGSEDREAAQVMVNEVDRLNRVITDLIGLSRPTDVRAVPAPLTPVIEHALLLLRPDAEARGVTLEFAPPPAELPNVLLDKDRLGQALLNIGLNAIDAMPKGGLLRVSLFRQGKDRLCLEVRDTGSGILPKDLAHIFDPYFTTKGHGTGLGLATVHKIVEAHGGEIFVTSRHHSEGQPSGTVFHLLLPPVGGS